MATSGGGPRHTEEDDHMRMEAHPTQEREAPPMQEMEAHPMGETEEAAPTKAEEGAQMPKETPEVVIPQAEATLAM